MWFPRPQASSDLIPLGAESKVSAEVVLALLTRADCHEWKDRVGQAGSSNASAKVSVRLLDCAGWVLKTDLTVRSDNPGSLRANLASTIALAQSSDLWHPSKKWLLMRIQGTWHPLTICRRLQTLREITALPERFSAWTCMLEKAVAFSARYSVGLDINPSNFGVDPHKNATVYYIDDELYPPLSILEVAAAIASRIPQDPSASVSDWRRWGSSLQQTLEGFLTTADEWRDLAASVSDYPMTEQYTGQRAALLEGLRAGHPFLDPAERKRRRVDKHALTCVMADVHANLPALEATIRSARERGADGFLFLGDVVGYGPHPRECIQRLAELPNAVLVRGNHDHAIGSGTFDPGMNGVAQVCARWTYDLLSAQEREWLASLPLEYCADGWLAVHGAPRDPHRILAYVYEMTYEENLSDLQERGLSVCFHGHTHVQSVYVRGRDGTRRRKGTLDLTVFEPELAALINPGAVGQPRDGNPTAAFALWERATNRVVFHRTAYSIEQVVEAIRKEGLPYALIDRLEAGR